MKAAVFLRIASIVALLQFLGHVGLLLSASPKHGATEVAVVETMKTHRFDFGGNSRSYWDFYLGYGLFAGFNCLVEAVLFWLLGFQAKAGKFSIRPFTALFVGANLVYIALAWSYFFITPILFDAVIALCLAFAYVSAGKHESLSAATEHP